MEKCADCMDQSALSFGQVLILSVYMLILGVLALAHLFMCFLVQ